jgi:CheY-like chemotaxis protein
VPRRDRAHPGEAAPIVAAAELRSLVGVHVLVLDDDEDARHIIAAAFRYCGALVTTADSAKRALHAMYTLKPHIIISDLHMPVEDGVSFMREVRAIPGYEITPAVAVTAYADLHRHAIDALFDAHLRKPVDPVALVSTVSRLLERRRGLASP